MAETARRTRKTLYVVTALYVAIGFVVLAGGALAGDRLSAFLGFLIVSGTLAVAIVLNVVLRLAARAAGVAQSVEDIRTRLERIEKTGILGETTRRTMPKESGTRVVDLSAFGPGDPTLITAATLDRSVFPRLVKTMDKAPPPEPAAASPSALLENSSSPDGHATVHMARHSAGELSLASAASKSLKRAWKVALREGDLVACRRVFSTLVDTADAQTVAALTAELEELAGRTEESLRAAFARSVRESDYAGALGVGEKIRSLLSDRPIAAEFERLKPHLLRRLEEPVEDGTTSHVVSRAGLQ